MGDDRRAATDRDDPAGSVVVSLTGHDRGRTYLVIASDPAFLFLTDGDKRPFSKPKKKRRRHVKAIGRIGDAESLIGQAAGIKVEADQSALIRKELTRFTAGHGNP